MREEAKGEGRGARGEGRGARRGVRQKRKWGELSMLSYRRCSVRKLCGELNTQLCWQRIHLGII